MKKLSLSLLFILGFNSSNCAESNKNIDAQIAKIGKVSGGFVAAIGIACVGYGAMSYMLTKYLKNIEDPKKIESLNQNNLTGDYLNYGQQTDKELMILGGTFILLGGFIIAMSKYVEKSQK